MIPKLKIVPLSKIVPVMEYSKTKVEYIKEIIETSGSIGTPISLIDMPDKNYLLLDDSSILKVAEDFDINFLPAQLTNQNQIIDIKAEIFIQNFKPELINEYLSIFPRVASICVGWKEIKQHKDDLKIVFSRNKEKDIAICFRNSNSEIIPGGIFDFIDFLKRSCQLTRKIYSNKIRTANIRPNQNSWSLKITGFNFNHVLSAVTSERCFPSGLIRFDYKCRVIGIDYPINVLNEKVSIREKEQFLYDLVNFRLNNDQTEYIEGGVYLLNYLVKK
ncbi:MAG: hypothetical protein GY865_08900 [candidate division Zixibacteria bacterium]|nr:hypothetical protein [candidate division Zixibacteria bacterium]